ncbi:MAG: toll/interleukin-1 receptor domain-containing protein [Ginsengibacter sp.]
MGYLANFQNDVFISYAHVDNSVRNQNDKGWVTQFCSELKFWITQRVGRSDKFKIWWDERLSDNHIFNDEIKDAIKNSALFITFSSNAYYESEYCIDELKWFYEHTSKSGIGMSVKNMYRIYNIRLNNIDHTKWPKESQGTSGYEMFTISNEEKEGLGFPITPGSEQFTKNIQRLADNIYEALGEIKNQMSVSKPIILSGKTDGVIKPKVFFAKVADTLLNDKNQIIRELEINNIDVIKKVPPPPFNKSEYESAVEKSLGDSCLSIHLFDSIAGDQIEDGSDTFTEAQVRIAKKMSKEQLIFIPKQLNFDQLENQEYKQFLNTLQNSKTDTDKYTLIRESAAPNITLEILEKINKITTKNINLQAPEGGNSPSVFLDFHEQDYKYAINMNNFLSEKGIRTFQCMSGSQPLENIEKFETALKNATAIIFILGTVAKEWIIERFNKAIETILIKDYPVSTCAIYLAPQIVHETFLLKRKFLQPQLLDDSKSAFFNPDTVIPFIQQFH